MAKYNVIIHCSVEDEDPRLIISDLAMELGSCWHYLEDLMIIAESEIQVENHLPESYSNKIDMLVWTEKSGYAEEASHAEQVPKRQDPRV